MTLAAVSEAGPLIHLAEIDSLELLAAFDTLLAPETVHDEVEAGGVPGELAHLSYELDESDESRVSGEQPDAGECAAIAVAKEQGVALLTDDFAAREAASDAGVEVYGSTVSNALELLSDDLATTLQRTAGVIPDGSMRLTCVTSLNRLLSNWLLTLTRH